MATESSLPEELLCEILSYCLSLSPERIASFVSIPPFKTASPKSSQPPASTDSTRPARSAAGVLLVCKRWLRIGTPLLYESVELASAAQIHAVLGLLRVNPCVRMDLRRLKVQGGCLDGLSELVRRAPRIHTLWIELRTYTVHSDLVRTLEAASPTSLTLDTKSVADKRVVAMLEQRVAKGLAACRSLGRIYLHENHVLTSHLGNVLGELHGLEEIHMGGYGALGSTAAGTLQLAAGNPSLRTIRCRGFSAQEYVEHCKTLLPCSDRICELLVAGER